MYELNTIGKLFLKRIEKSHDQNAIGWIDGETVRFISYQEYFKVVESTALGLLKLGLKSGDKLSILGHTCKEWHFIDMACLCIGVVVVPIYPTYTPDEVLYIYNHSESSAIAVENANLLNKLTKVKDKMLSLTALITFSALEPNERPEGMNLVSLQELQRNGNAEARQYPEKFKMLCTAVEEDGLASIIYTSGTTGEPKGAMIKQKAVSAMLANTQYSLTGTFSSKDRSLTFLPLSHVLGRADSMVPLVFGGELVFARSLETLTADMEIVCPSVMIAVPRVFEKMHEKIQTKFREAPFIQRQLIHWAEKVSNAYFEKIQQDLSPDPQEIVSRHLAFKLVFSKVYKKFGGKTRFFISGGAPLSVEIIKFLRNCNLTVLEGYGLTETIAPFTLNPPSKQIPGTVGIPLGNGEIRFAEDGEILLKSAGMFSGYFKNEEETQKSIIDGWFHTGDIGKFTPEGYLAITDRKKDIIITSGGKNIAPQKLENTLKTRPFISQALIIGDRRPFVSAVIGIEKANFIPLLEKLGLPKDCLPAELAQHPKVNALIQEQIDEANKGLASFETIKKFYISPEEFSVEGGHLTPSLKLKRKVLTEKFKNKINAMYSKA